MFILAPGEQRRRLFIIDDVWLHFMVLQHGVTVRLFGLAR
jgi:hypothetical protein